MHRKKGVLYKQCAIEPTSLGSNTRTTISKLCCTDVTRQGVKGFDLIWYTLHSSAKTKSQTRYSVIFLLLFYQNKHSYWAENTPIKECWVQKGWGFSIHAVLANIQSCGFSLRHTLDVYCLYIMNTDIIMVYTTHSSKSLVLKHL